MCNEVVWSGFEVVWGGLVCFGVVRGVSTAPLTYLPTRKIGLNDPPTKVETTHPQNWPVLGQLGLCHTYSETTLLVFSWRDSYIVDS